MESQSSLLNELLYQLIRDSCEGTRCGLPWRSEAFMWNLVTVCTQPKERPGQHSNEWIKQAWQAFLKDVTCFSFERVVRKRAFRVPGYHQPTMACLGQAVQSRFLNRSADMFLRYTYTPLAATPSPANVNQKSLKVSIKKIVFINTESLDVSFHGVLNAPETSLAPGRPSLVGAVASVRVARWGFGMAMDAILQDCDTESTFSLWWTLAWHFIYGSTYSERLQETEKLSSRRLWMFLAKMFIR